MLVPSAVYLNPGDVAWQLIAATLVGLMAVPGLAVLYGGLVQRRFAVNSAMMVLYAFAAVLLVWVLWGYQMSFGPALRLGAGALSAIVGRPGPVLGASALQVPASVPLLVSAMPALRFPQSAMIYFQFAFAAIAPGLMAGAALGRMNFKAWMLFVPIWTTLVYCVVAFSLWGGGILSQMGAVDYSGGYVIHLGAGVSGFVLAAMLGPRLAKDRGPARPASLMLALVGAGILWLGWNGFNGGDPYFANADAAVAVLNTNLAAATALLAWLALDVWTTGRASLSGAINGLIAGLVAITPAAGYVDGVGALVIGALAGTVPWLTMNLLGRRGLFRRVDDALGVIHTHGVAGALGGLLTGVLADPRVLVYLGVGPRRGASVAGLLYGNPRLLLAQFLALVAIVAYDASATYVVLRLVGLVVPLRAADPVIEAGDRAMHGEEAFDYGESLHASHRGVPAATYLSELGDA